MESSLSLARSSYQSAVAREIGFSPTSTDWTDAEAAVVNDCVDSGLRQFYFPAMPDGRVYEWSFLKPTRTLTLAASANHLDLPDDFGNLSGPITVSQTNAVTATAMYPGAIADILTQRAIDSVSTGQPQLMAVVPLKGTDITESQRFRLEVWPTADVAYSLNVSFSLLPEALSGSRPYAYGGVAHVETILESCLSIAEQRVNNEMGVHTQKFQERLAASVSYDMRLKPAALGYNGDGSDRLPWQQPWDYRSEATVTFNGTQWD